MRQKLRFVHVLILGALAGLAVFAFKPALATDEENTELGIEMKKNQSTASVKGALEKAGDKIRKYERAKTEPAQIVKGHPSQPAPLPKKATEPRLGARPFHLKNGKSIEGVIMEQGPKGVWVETDPGVKIYLRNNEILEDRN